MKRLLLSICVLSLSGMQLANAQCAPDPQFTEPGIYPDSVQNLACAVVDSLYSQVITVVIPTDTVADVSGTPVDFWIDSVELISATGFPPGVVNAGCSPSSCGWVGGTTGCLAVIGTPTTTGYYPLEIIVRSWVTDKATGFLKVSQDDTLDYYGINVVERLMLSATVTDPSGCSTTDGAIDLLVTGGSGAGTYEYLWSNSSTTEDLSTIAQGTYMVTVMDSCFTRSLSVTVGTPPVALVVSTVSETNPTTCTANDGAIDIDVSGGVGAYVYLWNDPNASTTQDVTGLDEGTYMIIVNDDCSTDTMTFTLSAPASTLALSTAGTNDPTGCTTSDGSIDLTVTGGSGAGTYIYLWDDPATSTTEDIGGLAEGTYIVAVTDSCVTKTLSVLLTAAGNTLVLTSSSVQVSTTGGNDGSIDASTTGGATPLTYSWSNGASTEDINNLIAGTYTLTVTDAGGCMSTMTVTITEPGVGIHEISTTGFSDLLNIPNPFSHETEIQFTLLGGGSLDFSVYNLIGKVVYSEKVNTANGLNKFMFSSEGMAPGIYIYSLNDGSAIATGRMIISQR